MSKNIIAMHFVLAVFLILFGKLIPHGAYVFLGSLWFAMLFGVLPAIFGDQEY